jgi:hypothetical protein
MLGSPELRAVQAAPLGNCHERTRVKKCYAIIMVHRVQDSEPKVSLVMDDQTGLQYLSFASRQ